MRAWNKYLTLSVALVAVGVLLSATGCASNSGRTDGDLPEVPAPVQLSEFERDLLSIKTADLTYIYVLRRKDKKPFESSDKSYLRESTPNFINRLLVTDGEKAVIFGSNFVLPQEDLDRLEERFNIEDLSEPPEQPANEEEN